MSDNKTVDIVGDGTDERPYQPDYDGDYDNAVYDWDSGIVQITIDND